ncbi:MAG: VCBS repeat-containing protein [Verrucomicrobiota bacterium]
MRPLISSLIFLTLTPLSPAEPWERHDVFSGKGGVQTAVAADFTHDGRPDIISSSDGKVRLFIAPDWEEITLYTFDNPRFQCIHSCVIDVDEDGDPDFIGAPAMGEVFWLQTPDDAANDRWTYRTIEDQLTGIHCLHAGDVDLDGKLDVIANSFKPEGPLASSIVWLKVPADPLNTADTWPRHVFAKGDAPGGNHYMYLGDIDGDGQPDITCGAKGDPFPDGNWFAWWKNPGPGTDPQSPWQKLIVAENHTGATNLIPVDLNNDLRTDLLASRGHGSGVLWFEQAADGRWFPHDIDPDMVGPHCLTAADLDNDGDIDGATCGKDSMVTRWYENDGDGSFTAHTIGRGHAAYDIRAVDMDGDTDLDLLIGGQKSGNVVWYANPLKQGLIFTPPAAKEPDSTPPGTPAPLPIDPYQPNPNIEPKNN